SLVTFALPTAAIPLLAVPVLVGSAVVWNALQGLLADDSAVLLIVPVTFLFVTVWGGGLALVGLVGTWRGLMASRDTLRSSWCRRSAGRRQRRRVGRQAPARLPASVPGGHIPGSARVAARRQSAGSWIS